jgi:hypothetical protein
MLKRIMYCISVVMFIAMILVNPLFAGHVELNKAQTAAENWLHHQVWTFSDWIDVDSTYPYIEGVEFVHYEGKLVAYNFLVNPQGHILVPARDELPPVKLYSTSKTQTFDQKEALPYFLETVLLELFEVTEAVEDVAFALDQGEMEHGALDYSENTRLWSLFEANTQDFVHGVLDALSAQKDMVGIGPLVTTTWAQGSPYNSQTPKWLDGKRTKVGCVATAVAQIMRYHKWPNTGTGSISYKWWNGEKNITLSRDFTKSKYGWSNMPKKLTVASSLAQKNAVAKISADVGIAFKMNYGPDGSTAFTSDVTTVLPKYFRYKNIKWVQRDKYPSDSAWMKVFRKEVQNKRPAILSIAENNNGKRENGHAVVVSGYRDTPSEQIHINMGWNGSYNGWYASNNIKTGVYNFNWLNQEAGIGIEPKLTCGRPVSIKVPASSATGKYIVSWAASSTSGVKYVLQEATNKTFTSGLRRAYSGTGTRASITGRSSGKTYYYRVKAIRSGYTDSAWRTAGNGCKVTIPTSKCANIAGAWRASETVTITCCSEGYCETETYSETGTINIQQNGCNISYGSGPYTRKGTIDGNKIKMSGLFAIFEPGSGCTATQNSFVLNGTVDGNQMNWQGSGILKGQCDGFSFSCTGRSTVKLARLGSSLDPSEAMVDKESIRESSKPLLNDCIKIFSILAH